MKMIIMMMKTMMLTAMIIMMKIMIMITLITMTAYPHVLTILYTQKHSHARFTSAVFSSVFFLCIK